LPGEVAAGHRHSARQQLGLLLRGLVKSTALAVLVATEAEKVELYDGLVAYAGTYTVEGDRVTHRIEVSWNQSWTGTAVVRTFAVEGDRVRLQTAPSPGPFGGREGIGVLIWQRVE
jgi:Lipocalin-like domain